MSEFHSYAHQDLDTTIRVFTSLAFADLESLGFDQTVSRLKINNKIQYKFQIGDNFYITMATLADYAADFIRGRGTRVFKAYLESDPKVIVALKDMWMEDDRTEEGVLLMNMRASMREMQSEGFEFPGDRDPSQYFLTVHAHGRVKIADGRDDHTSNIIMRGLRLPADLKYLITPPSQARHLRSSRVLGSDRSYSMGHTPEVTREAAALISANVPRQAERFQPRIHCRIAFNEVGRTVHNIHRLSDVYQCLVDATIGVFLNRPSRRDLVLTCC
jgi:Fungal protein kinase